MSTMVIFKGRRVQGGIVSYIRGALKAGRIQWLAGESVYRSTLQTGDRGMRFIRSAEDMLSKKTQKRYFEMGREKNV